MNIEQTLNYKCESSLTEEDNHQTLQLVAAADPTGTPTYFEGELKYPRQTAKCLRAISTLVGTRFYIPPAMLARILREADPVVTTGKNTMRFEGFSACCSAYARLDILDGGFEATKLSPGTTNVDFQAEMRAALSKVRDSSDMSLNVSSDEVTVSTSDDNVVERKVKLPIRWVKGFSELQAQQIGATKRFEIKRVEALRFLKQLPRAKTKQPAWLVKSGSGLRLAHRESKDGIKLVGTERLKVLEDLASISDSLSVYSDNQSSLSVWVLSIGPQRFTLVLSSEPWRGFSGEGNLLKHLAASRNDTAIAKVKSSLKWQDQIDPNELANELNESTEDVGNALALFASRGLVGFDITTNSYFHRVLPFNMELVDELHPRLLDARKLFDKGHVKLEIDGDVVKADVLSSDVTHHIVINDNEEKCTCPWYAKHKNSRGPCKHILATHIALEDSE